MMNLAVGMSVITKISPVLNEMGLEAFAPIYCMLLEEWCFHNNEDIVNVISMVKDLIIGVQETEGKYCY